ncbi:MAG: [FeFe] hydrogenase H-cluster radical SAM maturase HydG [Chitinispirillaceae bacterium]|nr:[FeFe] hydrogenase H-cluster radical SAM maturase HydG [Chitinispirillaceae bacterium]
MNVNVKEWIDTRIHEDQISKYIGSNGDDFINDTLIEEKLETAKRNGTNKQRVREIIQKSLGINTLSPEEVAILCHVEDPELWKEMETAAGEIKRKVYDNRIVTFAPLYLSNACVNNCAYCGLRTDNKDVNHGILSLDQVKREAEILAGSIGHKRLIVVYGEHPLSDSQYIADTLRAIYSVKVKTRKGEGGIRRVNVNAAPMSVEDLRMLNEVGIGTYQVFQETYHHQTYRNVHPQNTLKGNYRWRITCMHRSLEAGIDDVGIGALFGLYDWRFEIMGLLYHTIELESKFGLGPHTISFPRIEPAENTPFNDKSNKKVKDDDFRKAIVIIRLAVPYTGMILTARENAKLRRELIPLGITQTDASSKIGLGAYNDAESIEQVSKRQQFILGDTRSLDEVVRELAQMGYITSFCTAGYRCGRTGQCIMDLLKSGAEGKFCKLNAVITFREWLDDFASDETRLVGEPIIMKEIEEIRTKMPQAYESFMENYKKTVDGQRDLYF